MKLYELNDNGEVSVKTHQEVIDLAQYILDTFECYEDYEKVDFNNEDIEAVLSFINESINEFGCEIEPVTR